MKYEKSMSQYTWVNIIEEEKTVKLILEKSLIRNLW